MPWPDHLVRLQMDARSIQRFSQRPEGEFMQILKRYKNGLTRQFSVAILFAAIAGLASDCHAQHHRGLFNRGARGHHLAPINDANTLEATATHDRSSVYRQPDLGYQTDWRREPSYFPAAPAYPKFYGGFHSSEFSNLGVPSGDIGFRGNGIYWTPW